MEEQDDLSQKELFEHYKFAADKGQELLRIDKFLMARISNSTRSKLQTAITEGNVFVNKRIIKSNYKVKPLQQ